MTIKFYLFEIFCRYTESPFLVNVKRPRRVAHVRTLDQNTFDKHLIFAGLIVFNILNKKDLF